MTYLHAAELAKMIKAGFAFGCPDEQEGLAVISAIVEREEIIGELLEELQEKARSDHRDLAIRALRVLGLTTDEIRAWFAGELIL